MTRALRGAFAGLLGVAAMAGVIGTLRRALLSSEQLAASRTHPEKIVQRIADEAELGTLEDQTRRRAGDAIHFGYGALWGAIVATALGDRPVKILGHGLGLGLGLWAWGFNVMLPAMGAHPGTWTWRRREYVLTLSAHASYGVVTAGTIRLFQLLSSTPEETP